jgi:hypothetical protein
MFFEAVLFVVIIALPISDGAAVVPGKASSVFDSQKPNLLAAAGVNIALAHASNTRISPVAHTVPDSTTETLPAVPVGWDSRYLTSRLPDFRYNHM